MLSLAITTSTLLPLQEDTVSCLSAAVRISIMRLSRVQFFLNKQLVYGKQGKASGI